jgi:hypothetical protein
MERWQNYVYWFIQRLACYRLATVTNQMSMIMLMFTGVAVVAADSKVYLIFVLVSFMNNTIVQKGI